MLLDEQLFNNPKFQPFLTENYIILHAVFGEKLANTLEKEYNVIGLPTVLITNPDGTEISRIVGYEGPPEAFKIQIEENSREDNPLAVLEKKYKENPEDLEAAFKLAFKYENLYLEDKNKELFEKILSRPDEAKKIMVPFGDEGETISIYEYSWFLHGDLDEFIEEFPESKLSRDAYFELSRLHWRGDLEKSSEFYKKMLAKYPEDPDMLRNYVVFCIFNETELEDGLRIAVNLYNSSEDPSPVLTWNYAQILALNDEREKLNEVYGEPYAKRERTELANNLARYVRFWSEQNENIDDVIAQAKLIFELDNTYRSSVAEILEYAAMKYIDEGNIDGAIQIYGSEFIKNYMASESALLTYAGFWVREGKNLESALEAAKLNSEKFDKTLGPNMVARVYLKMDKLDEALKIYGPEYFKNHVTDAAALSFYTSFWVQEGKNLESALEAHLQREKLTNGKGGLSRLARIYSKMGKIEEVPKEYGPDYLARENLGVLSLRNYSSFWVEQGTNLESALEAGLRAKEMYKERGAPINIMVMVKETLTKIYLQMDRMEEALKEYGTEHINTCMTDANSLRITLNNYAMFWAQEGKNLEHALEIAKKSTELNPDRRSWDALSLVYLRLGKYEESTDAEQEALKYPRPYQNYPSYIEDIKKDMKKGIKKER